MRKGTLCYSDFEYVKRKKTIESMSRYFTSMINKINGDYYFHLGGVRFSDRVDSSNHFFIRIIDRNIDINRTFQKFYKFVFEKQCEIIYYVNLKNRPPKLNLCFDGVRICLTLHDKPNYKMLVFRTVYKYKTISNTKIDVFQISENR